MNNNKLTQLEYIKSLEQLEHKVYPKNPLKKKETKIWKMRLNLIKDNWKYSIKPMFLDYKPFDFETRIDYFANKSTPWVRLKELVLGVFYIAKSTLTYVPLGYKR
jgi:hypothetical protein